MHPVFNRRLENVKCLKAVNKKEEGVIERVMFLMCFWIMKNVGIISLWQKCIFADNSREQSGHMQ